MEVTCSDNLIHIKMSSVHWLVASSATNSVLPSASKQCCQHYSAGNSAQEQNMFDWCRLCLKRDGTRAETRFHLSAKVTSPFKSAGGRQFSRLLAAQLCASAVLMLDTSCSEVV